MNDLFAGPGGWDVAARELGLDPLGIEYDDAACATREAAGLRTLQTDVAALDPADHGPCDLLIASPPCQAFSAAGRRQGENDLHLIHGVMADLFAGRIPADDEGDWADPRSRLVTEPLRWVRDLRPTYVALEQVPPVLPLWGRIARYLRDWGYAVWTGVLSSERFGVPQTRKRAILMAALDGPVHPPQPTHQRYVPGEPARHELTLEGELLPWVSMAEALGWNGVVGFPRRADDNGEVTEDGYRARDFRNTDEPAFNLTEKVRSWTLRANAQANAAERKAVEPAPTITGGNDTGDRVWRWDEEGGPGDRRVTLEEAAVLQSFPFGYPFRGSKTKQFEQVGNAIPPLLAQAILAALPIPSGLTSRSAATAYPSRMSEYCEERV